MTTSQRTNQVDGRPSTRLDVVALDVTGDILLENAENALWQNAKRGWFARMNFQAFWACRSSWNSSKSTVLNFKFGNTTPSHTAARTFEATKAAENGKQYGSVMCLKDKDLTSWWLLALAKTKRFQTTLISSYIHYLVCWILSAGSSHGAWLDIFR